MASARDRELGMYRKITRRDFVNGAALTVGAAMIPPSAWALGEHMEAADGYYPPARTGLRGSHAGSFETMHAMRDGNFWTKAGAPHDTLEHYDLVVVGGGISGLAAAHFYRKVAGEKARILILENHDDFGGHAKRNELKVNGRTLLCYGGTYSIESAAPYSAVAKGLIEELGIDVPSFSKHRHLEAYTSRKLNPAIFFDKENYGSDRLVQDPVPVYGSESTPFEVHDPEKVWERFLADVPISEQARKDYQRLATSKADYLPGLSSNEKKAKLARMSYAQFLTDLVKVDEGVLKLVQNWSSPLFGAGIETVPAQDAWWLGYPGFDGMKLDPTPGPGMPSNMQSNDDEESYFFHFPDGNASIARLLVRKLIPGSIPGSTMDDIVTARADYSMLDRKLSPVRIRLNSSVVKVKHVGPAAHSTGVDVTYMREGNLQTVHAKQCVLACWHMVIPYICPELPDAQKEAIHYGTKVPLIYTSVAVRDWKAWEKLKTHYIYAPNAYWTNAMLDWPVSIGEHKCSCAPEEPIVVHITRTPCQPGADLREQHRVGRSEMYQTTFETYERQLRDQLGRMLGAGGFDPARDIAGITVNRWPHGYAYEYNTLYDDFLLEGGTPPCETARKPFGRIAIANSDAGAYAYTDGAIDQAHRAVQELVGKKS
jgi:spermidine dehydrogenase